MPPSRLPAYLATLSIQSSVGSGRRSSMKKLLWGFSPAVLKRQDCRPPSPDQVWFLWGEGGFSEAQKVCVASRAPPRKDWGAARHTPQTASKRPDLRSIISSKKKAWGWCAQNRGGVSPRGGAQKVPAENRGSFPAPSGDRCTISATTGVSGGSSLQQSVTCSVASCHVLGHRTFNIPPAKPGVKSSAPFGEIGSVDTTAKHLSLGRKDCRERLQDTVCASSSAFQWRGLHFRETGTSTFIDTLIASSAGQKGHRTCSPARQRVRLLQPVFSGSQERWRVASNFRSSRIETYKFKNVNDQTDCFSDPIGIGSWQSISRTHTCHNTGSSWGSLSEAKLTSIGFFRSA